MKSQKIKKPTENDRQFKVLVLKILLILLDRFHYIDGLDIPWSPGEVVRDVKRYIQDFPNPKK